MSALKVLIVDDSVVYRSKIRSALSGTEGIEIAGVASNGKIALEMMEQKSVDLVTLDMEMPVMDGLETLKAIRSRDRSTKVIMFSSSTVRGSEATLEALTSGADDFVTKPVAEGSSGVLPEEIIRKELLPKIEQFFLMRGPVPSPARGPALSSPVRLVPPPHRPTRDLDTFRPSAIVIASSTGGPSTHEAIFTGICGPSERRLKVPIFIAQHMPPVFTAAFAKRIASHSGLPCKEAVHGETVRNEIYVAPGDYHLTLKRDGDRIVTLLDKVPPRNSVRPAADFLFESASLVYAARCMGFVLTGMGEDGLAGSQALKAAGGGIMIQDEASCVVFGMPAAVYNAGIHDGIGPPAQIQRMLARMALE